MLAGKTEFVVRPVRQHPQTSRPWPLARARAAAGDAGELSHTLAAMQAQRPDSAETELPLSVACLWHCRHAVLPPAPNKLPADVTCQFRCPRLPRRHALDPGRRALPRPGTAYRPSRHRPTPCCTSSTISAASGRRAAHQSGSHAHAGDHPGVLRCTAFTIDDAAQAHADISRYMPAGPCDGY